jgi:hypothetical protein
MRSSSCTSSSPSVSSHDIPASIIVVVAVRRRSLFDAKIVDSIRNLVLPILVVVDRDGDGKSTIIIGVGEDVQACDTREDSGSIIIHNIESAENDDLVIMLLVPEQWILKRRLVVALMEVLCCCCCPQRPKSCGSCRLFCVACR